MTSPFDLCSLSQKPPYLWLFPLSAARPEVLLPEEKAYAKRLRSRQAMMHFVAGRSLLRTLFASLLGRDQREIRFTQNRWGKPQLADKAPYHFSLSHKAGLVLLAVGESPLGVDLEIPREVRLQALAEKFFFPEEKAWIALAKGHEQRKNRFFFLWSAKEAALKADGCGITRGLRHASLIFDEQKPNAVMLHQKRWELHSFLYSESPIADRVIPQSPSTQESFDVNEKSSIQITRQSPRKMAKKTSQSSVKELPLARFAFSENLKRVQKYADTFPARTYLVSVALDRFSAF